jgi:hypothetical protein
MGRFDDSDFHRADAHPISRREHYALRAHIGAARTDPVHACEIPQHEHTRVISRQLGVPCADVRIVEDHVAVVAAADHCRKRGQTRPMTHLAVTAEQLDDYRMIGPVGAGVQRRELVRDYWSFHAICSR